MKSSPETGASAWREQAISSEAIQIATEIGAELQSHQEQLGQRLADVDGLYASGQITEEHYNDLKAMIESELDVKTDVVTIIERIGEITGASVEVMAAVLRPVVSFAGYTAATLARPAATVVREVGKVTIELLSAAITEATKAGMSAGVEILRGIMNAVAVVKQGAD